MGFANKDVVRACEQARLLLRYLEAELSRTQAGCSHPKADVNTGANGRFYCRRCSAVWRPHAIPPKR